MHSNQKYYEITKDLLTNKNGKSYFFNNIRKLGGLSQSSAPSLDTIDRLPFSLKILLESLVRNHNEHEVRAVEIESFLQWTKERNGDVETPFMPSRVILQDFTGVPALVDLASMRDAVKRLGGNPQKINPLVPVSLVIDHSVQIDYFASKEALQKNLELEFSRNNERYQFLKWGQHSLNNFSVVPPASGIIHQVNLEYIANGIMQKEIQGETILYPDSLVGTDSHTTMINGLGILGWGVGGIEAEAVMLGQPLYMLAPEVVGFKITGKLRPGSTATDIALTATQILRQNNVVGKFVEFFGSGLSNMTLADRATIANMAPEYGATMGFFPMDAEAMRYLRLTGRDPEWIDLVEMYMKQQGLFRTDQTLDPIFDQYLELDLSTVMPSIAGPKRPQDRIELSMVKKTFQSSLTAPADKRGFALNEKELNKNIPYPAQPSESLSHGSVVIASITSCTNTSNPSVLIAAALLARKAAMYGLKVPKFVKTSFAPGSLVVREYLQKANLLSDLEKIGFHIVGFGCTTCIGNSGPLPEATVQAIQEGNLIAASVLSGNRNFEGRIHANVKANFLASPPLVVAYALAGSMDKDLTTEPIGITENGQQILLKDIWPTEDEINTYLSLAENPETYKQIYNSISSHNELWNKIPLSRSELYPWDENSTYIQNPPFFQTLTREVKPISSLNKMRVLVKVGDSITTDHISPAGSFKAETPAGKYLTQLQVNVKDFNSYGSRRGNDRIMTRGTFANIRLKNQLAPGTEGGFTKFFGEGSLHGQITTIFDASVMYQEQQIPLMVIAGKDYGMGSSRDWAAKGTFLLGVRAVIAESFERIHRSNLVGMGILPLQFLNGQNADSLKLTGEEFFSIELTDELKPRQQLTVKVSSNVDDPNGKERQFDVLCRIDSPIEVEYYRNGGILQTVLRQLLD